MIDFALDFFEIGTIFIEYASYDFYFLSCNFIFPIPLCMLIESFIIDIFGFFNEDFIF